MTYIQNGLYWVIVDDIGNLYQFPIISGGESGSERSPFEPEPQAWGGQPITPRAIAPTPATPAPATPPPPPPTSAITDLASKHGYGTADAGGGLGSMNIPGLPAGFVAPPAPAPSGTGAGTPAPTSTPAPASTPHVGGLTQDPWTTYQQEVSADVPYLRSPLTQTTEGQAQRQMAIDPINARYEHQKQALTEDLGRRGIMPSSGIFIEQMQHLDDERNQAINEIDRQWAGGTTNRLASSRDITLGLSREEQARQMQAAGLEQTLYDQERQRLADELAAASGQTLAPAANTAGTLLQAGQAQQALQAQSNAALGRGLGSMASMYFMPQQTLANPSSYFGGSLYDPSGTQRFGLGLD